MEEIISRVCGASGVDAGTAERAVFAILGFVRREGPVDEVGILFAAMPGADAAVENSDALGMPSGGLFGGGLMALAGQLSGLGLSLGEMQSIGGVVFDYMKEKAGDETVRRVGAGIPGLSQFL